MQYILFDIYANYDSELSRKLKYTILNEYPYGRFDDKIELEKSNNKKRIISIKNILVPVNYNNIIEDSLIKYPLNIRGANSKEVASTIINIFNDIITKLSIQIISIIDDSNFNIMYSDGSGNLKTGIASYGVVHLFKNKTSDCIDCGIETFTNDNFYYVPYKESFANATNNIGELSGIGKAVDLCEINKINIIISDSKYSIDTFREFIYSWLKNGFKTASKEPVKNKELIESIYNKIKNSNSLILFLWTKGHKDSFFNKICDKLAEESRKEYEQRINN